MRFNLLSLGMLLTAGAMLQGCSTEEIEVPAEELYARDFIKTFGVIDPKQDWTAAQKSNVTVKTSAPTRVKVIAEFNGKQYLFADYTEVSGTEKLTFDLPKGVSDITVRANGRDIKTTIGSTVDLASKGSREASAPGLTYTVEEEWRYVPLEVVKSYTTKVPEGMTNLNVENVVEDFSFKSTSKPFTFYPIYWQTSAEHDLYVFWYDKDHYGEPEYYHEQMIYQSKTGKLQSYTGEEYPETVINPASDERWGKESDAKIDAIYFDEIPKEDGWKPTWSEEEYNQFIENWYNENRGKYIEAKYGVKGYLKSCEKCAGYSYPNSVEWNLKLADSYYPATEEHESIGAEELWVNADKGESSINAKHYVRTKPITFEFDEEGVQFGLFIVSKAGDAEHRCYSASHLNQTDKRSVFYAGSGMSSASEDGWSKISLDYTGNYSTASYFHTTTEVTIDGKTEVRNRTFFGFEDWGGGHVDLNDLIFLVNEETVKDIPVIEEKPEPDPDPFTWIVACEDLGGTFDYDFNDVVFGVQYIPGYDNRVYVTGLAAGGTLPIHLYYNGVELTGAGELDQKVEEGNGPFAEWHGWFGKASTQIVNVKGDFAVGATVSFVPNDKFTMSADLNEVNSGINTSVHGFYVMVEKNGKLTLIKRPTETGEPGDKTPQMFVTTVNFQWPFEMTPIYATHRGTGADRGITVNRYGHEYKSYEHGFQHWVTDANADFHTQGLSHPGQTVNHGWTGFMKTPRTN